MYCKAIKEIVKINHIIGDRGREIAAIKEAIERVSITIELQLKQGYPKEKSTYQQNPLQWLVCKCNRRLREIRETIYLKENETNIKFYEMYTLMKGKVVKSRAIKEAIREIDAEMAKKEYAGKKL